MIYNVHVLYFLCVNLKLILDNNLSLRNNPTVVREVKLTLYQIRLSILHYTQASKIFFSFITVQHQWREFNILQ